MPEVRPRHHYRQAFIMSPVFKLRMIEVARMSDGLAVVEGLGEGDLLVSIKKMPAVGVYAMAKCTIQELRGKTETEIFAILDRRMDAEIERERVRLNRP